MARLPCVNAGAVPSPLSPRPKPMRTHRSSLKRTLKASAAAASHNGEAGRRAAGLLASPRSTAGLTGIRCPGASSHHTGAQTRGRPPGSVERGRRVAEQAMERLATGQEMRTIVLVVETALWVNAQEIENRRGQVVGPQRIERGMGTSRSLGAKHLAPRDAGPRQREAEDVPPVIPPAGRLLILGVRPNSPMATTSVSSRRPRCSRSSSKAVKVTSNCGHRQSCKRSAFWAWVSHMGLSTAESPGWRAS